MVDNKKLKERYIKYHKKLIDKQGNKMFREVILLLIFAIIFGLLHILLVLISHYFNMPIFNKSLSTSTSMNITFLLLYGTIYIIFSIFRFSFNKKKKKKYVSLMPYFVYENPSYGSYIIDIRLNNEKYEKINKNKKEDRFFKDWNKIKINNKIGWVFKK
jgi:hypothetical protein